MNDLDLGSLEAVLSQNDLKLRWHIGYSASGNERLDKAPKKAHFYWRHGDQQVYGIEVARDELENLIQTLEAKNLKVPEAFHEALQKFPT